MLKKTISYVDYNGENQTDEFFFNLSNAEIIELEMLEKAGLKNTIETMINTKDKPGIYKLFKKIVLLSYGEKSADGKRFIKSEEMATAFSQTEAYSALMVELMSDDKSVSDFINAIIPKNKDQDKPEVATKA